MGQILLFIFALVIIIVVFVLLVSRKEAGKHGTSTGEEFVGICRSAYPAARPCDIWTSWKRRAKWNKSAKSATPSRIV